MSMLFWQFDGVGLSEEILNAKRFYANKYKVEPQIVFVHPTTLVNAFPAEKQPVDIHGLRVKADVTILKNTLHMGMDKDVVVDA